MQQHLRSLEERALEAVNPLNRKIREVHNQLDVALLESRKAREHASDLAQRLKELTNEAERLRTGFASATEEHKEERRRLEEEIADLRRRLALARERAEAAERYRDGLGDLLERLLDSQPQPDDLVDSFPVEDAHIVNQLFQALRDAGSHDRAAALADRAVRGVSINGWAVESLLRSLHEAGLDTLVASLAERIAASFTGEEHLLLHRTLGTLRDAGLADIARTMASQAAANAPLENIGSVAGELHRAGFDDLAATLADRAVTDFPVEKTIYLGSELKDLWQAGFETQAATLADRAIAEGAIRDLGYLVAAMQQAGFTDRAVKLADRAVIDFPVQDTIYLTGVLGALRENGFGEHADRLADKAVKAFPVTDTWRIRGFLEGLREAGCVDHAVKLAERALVDLPLDDMHLPAVLDVLRAEGFSEHADLLEKWAERGARPRFHRLFGKKPRKEDPPPPTGDDRHRKGDLVRTPSTAVQHEHGFERPSDLDHAPA